MKIRFVFICLATMLSVCVYGQKKKQKEQKEQPAQQTPVQSEPKKDTVKQETPRQLTVPEIFTQHFARKYAIAIQWNDYDVAKDALYDLIAENPANDSIIFDLAYFYFQNQKYASSVLISQELLKRNPKNLTVLEMAGASFESLGALDKALQSYESMYLLGNSPVSLYKMAFLQYRLKRYKESVTSADILLTNKEVDTLKVSFSDAQGNAKEYTMKVALLNLKGMLAKDQGDKPGAKKLFEQALALAPDFAIAKQNIADLNK